MAQSFWQRLLYGPSPGEAKGMSSLNLWKEVYGGRESKSGQNVTVATAMEATAVLGCVRAIGEGVAQARIKFYTSGERAQRIRQHPVLDLLTW